MQLYTFPSSPFGTKVKSVASALEIAQKIEIVEYYPWQKDNKLRELNPLNKIPVLIVNNEIIFDSKVICEYLISIHDKTNKLIKNYIETLKIQSLTDGMLEAAILMRYETHFRPKNLQSKDWYNRQKSAVINGLNYLNNNHFNLEISFLGICIANALNYFDLRFENELWNEKYPSIFNWRNEYTKKHSFFKLCMPVHKNPPDEVICIKN